MTKLRKKEILIILGITILAIFHIYGIYWATLQIAPEFTTKYSLYIKGVILAYLVFLAFPGGKFTQMVVNTLWLYIIYGFFIWMLK